MNILPGIKIKNKALWLPHERVLIIADLHMGYEEFLAKKGILAPRTQFEEMKREIEELLNEVKPKIIIINGDIKHEFGDISEQEWKDTFKIMSLLDENCEKIVLVRGNHDTIIEPIIRRIGKRKIKVVDEFAFGDICVLHGHKIDVRMEKRLKKVKVLIIAHEHPAISLKEGLKVERYKCFLVGKWKNKKLIVMPSFLPIVEGQDMIKEDILSPFLKQNLNNFDVFIVSDKVYEFGKLGKIRLVNM